MVARQDRWHWFVLGLIAAICCGCGDRRTGDPRPNASVVAEIRDGLAAGVQASSADRAPGQVDEPTGYATLSGTFRLSGQPPAPTALNVNKDVEVCAPGGKTVYVQDLVVDPASGGIANVVIYADSIPESWVHESARPGRTDEVIFDQKECVFMTHVVAIQTTQKLRVLNSDPVGHNLMVSTFNQTIPSEGYAIYQPLKEDRSPVEMRCSIHPWMQGWMLIRDNGYFAVTAADGSFQIPNLPAGVPLELRVWQEKIGAVQQVTVNGQATKWSKGQLALQLEPDQATSFEVVLDASLFQR